MTSFSEFTPGWYILGGPTDVPHHTSSPGIYRVKINGLKSKSLHLDNLAQLDRHHDWSDKDADTIRKIPAIIIVKRLKFLTDMSVLPGFFYLYQ